ncbi:RNaseH domain-containing protein [Pseudomonas moorei]|uniref:RNaseH domain-containing protein n=1 Tax=Pseudomonas moorei TaxID=395599 RepID=UPI001FF66C0F|nr:RNaseH domain-containing protein [Pseudomonas moorei]
MKTLELRTTLFRFDPAQLGDAYRVQVGEHYLSAWQALQGLTPRPHPGLPTTGLEEMLAVLSGGPVKVNLFPQKDGGISAILLLKPIPIDVLNQALLLWSMDVLRIWNQQLEGLEGKLIVTGLVPLRASNLVEPGYISSLAYTVIPWLVGQALIKNPMQASRPIQLYQSADTTLLAWDAPIVSETNIRNACALHAIEPKLVLLRGRDEPYLQLRVKLSQVMPSWVGKKKHAWVRVGDLIVKAKIKTRRIDEDWKTTYEHPVEKLLAYMGVPSFPEIKEGNIPADSDVRPIYSIPPSTPLIASGPGPQFLDQAGFHLLSSLPGTSPLLVKKAVTSMKQVKREVTGEVVNLSVMVLAAHSELVLRLHAASQSLGKDSQFFRKVPPPLITLARLDVPDAQRMLAGEHDTHTLNEWLLNHVIPTAKQQKTRVAIIETDSDAAALLPERDPKHLIRRVFAEHGIATQFIMHTDAITEPKKKRKAEDARDFKAINSIIEAIRLSGHLPAPTPRIKAMPASTTVLAIVVDRIQDKGWSTLLPVITRAALGSHTPEVFWFEPGSDFVGKWFSYTDGLTAIHATASLLTSDMLKKLITQSLLVPTPTADSPLIVCLDSNLRTFYGGLKDSAGQGLPPVPQGAAIVRIRADEDVAQISGNHTFSSDTPHYIGPKIGVFQSCESPDVYYFISPSKQFGTVRSQRHNTRYDVSERDLRDPWQQLGVTEITIIEPGTFASATAIAEQVALLCRNAPLWDGYLRLPGLMHLGAQIAGDHPILEMRRKTEANRAG